LPYQIENTPSTLRALEQVDLLAAPDRGRREILVDARLEVDVVAFRCVFAPHSAWS
jgi:hypothetical protein